MITVTGQYLAKWIPKSFPLSTSQTYAVRPNSTPKRNDEGRSVLPTLEKANLFPTYRRGQPNWDREYTMWKFQDFSATATQTLREISFGPFEPPKTAHFDHLSSFKS